MIRCDNCKNWQLQNTKMFYGYCVARKIVTEACAGIIWQTKTRIKICSYYDSID